MSEVTKAFKRDYNTRYAEEVAKIAQQGGKKDRIDTADELEALRELPQKLADWDGISMDERGYILEQSPKDLEKTEEKAVKDARNEGHVRDKAREAVDRLKNDVTPNKALDNKAEAEKLIQQILDNGETYAWNLHEIEYFKMELIKAGFGDLLKEKLMQGTSAPVESKKESEEADVPKNEQDGKGGVSDEEQKPADEPVGYNVPPEEPGKTEESGNKSEPIDNGKASPAPKIKYKPFPQDKEPSDDKPGPTSSADSETKYTLNSDAINVGNSIADNLIDHLKAPITGNSKVKNTLKKVDDENAYTFIGRILNSEPLKKSNDEIGIGLNEMVLKNISDIYGSLSYKDTNPVMQHLLNQAKAMGLENDPAYTDLKKATDKINDRVDINAKEDPSRAEAQTVDAMVKALYDVMSEKLKN